MLSKKEFELFRMELEKATEALAKKFDVTIKAGKIKYSADSFNLDLKVNKKEVNGKSFEQSEFEKYAETYGFMPEDYKKEFVSNGKTFTLIAFKTSARTLPVLAIAEDGRRYKFRTDVKERLLKVV